MPHGMAFNKACLRFTRSRAMPDFFVSADLAEPGNSMLGLKQSLIQE